MFTKGGEVMGGPFNWEINWCSVFSANAKLTPSASYVKNVNYIINFSKYAFTSLSFLPHPPQTRHHQQFNWLSSRLLLNTISNKDYKLLAYTDYVFIFLSLSLNAVAPRQQSANVLEWKGNIYTLFSKEQIIFYK